MTTFDHRMTFGMPGVNSAQRGPLQHPQPDQRSIYAAIVEQNRLVEENTAAQRVRNTLEAEKLAAAKDLAAAMRSLASAMRKR